MITCPYGRKSKVLLEYNYCRTGYSEDQSKVTFSTTWRCPGKVLPTTSTIFPSALSNLAAQFLLCVPLNPTSEETEEGGLDGQAADLISQARIQSSASSQVVTRSSLICTSGLDGNRCPNQRRLG